jgi:hypothetical protein
LKKAAASGKKSKGNRNGSVGNKGNRTVGRMKRTAGRRSWLKRQASDVLIIKEPWLELILEGKKTWEIRGTRTKKRGVIHLARSGGGSIILGSALLTDCISLSREELKKNKDKHCIPDMRGIDYSTIHAWVLKDVRRYKKPLQYKHARGAIIWVKAHKWFVDGRIEACLFPTTNTSSRLSRSSVPLGRVRMLSLGYSTALILWVQCFRKVSR